MQANLIDDAIIGGASERLAIVLRECGNKCIVDHGALVSKDAVIGHGWTVNVCIRGAHDNERQTHPELKYRVMLRVNLHDCPRTDIEKHATVEHMVDRFLLVHEHALNVLVLTWRNKAAPFYKMVLRHNQVSPTDSWVGHINTSKDGVWRCDHWMVVKP